MNAPNRPQALDRRQVWTVDAMTAAGWRQHEIAAHFDISTDTVRSITYRRGAYAGMDEYMPQTPEDGILHAALIRALQRKVQRTRKQRKEAA